MEIIDNDIYDATTTGGANCAVLMDHTKADQSMTMAGAGKNMASVYTAVADLIEDYNNPEHPGELVPEIVRVRSGYVSVWKVYKHEGKWIQRLVWDKKQTSTSGGGNPVIADFDGDGQRDTSIPSNRVLKRDCRTIIRYALCATMNRWHTTMPP